jgi:hypothetical protein
MLGQGLGNSLFQRHFGFCLQKEERVHLPCFARLLFHYRELLSIIDLPISRFVFEWNCNFTLRSCKLYAICTSNRLLPLVLSWSTSVFYVCEVFGVTGNYTSLVDHMHEE